MGLDQEGTSSSERERLTSPHLGAETEWCLHNWLCAWEGAECLEFCCLERWLISSVLLVICNWSSKNWCISDWIIWRGTHWGARWEIEREEAGVLCAVAWGEDECCVTSNSVCLAVTGQCNLEPSQNQSQSKSYDLLYCIIISLWCDSCLWVLLISDIMLDKACIMVCSRLLDKWVHHSLERFLWKYRYSYVRVHVPERALPLWRVHILEEDEKCVMNVCVILQPTRGWHQTALHACCWVHGRHGGCGHQSETFPCILASHTWSS